MMLLVFVPYFVVFCYFMQFCENIGNLPPHNYQKIRQIMRKHCENIVFELWGFTAFHKISTKIINY
nr:MAG TPA: hypothetical protein [Caudoviricetes sp.]